MTKKMNVFNMLSSALTKEEAIALARSAKRLPPKPMIVQIGAWVGTSTVAILETRPDAFIFSVDIKPRMEEFTNLKKYGLDTRRVLRILGDSGKMDWPYPVDMIYIDGDHRYDGVKADCEAWLSKVKPGGLVVFHDYIKKRPPPKNQVARVVDVYCKDMKEFIRAGKIIGFVK